ncbi:hypothetical protein C0992_004251 [Termitomyces sp. T32_za158]|nr:hypothetical protein C0992_004251 [Termitomyces sp. T32_za158]
MDTKATTAKTISRGTLGLRFMQNAQRAKQLKELEFEKAEVKDDGQWEVDQRVREAWGTASTSSNSQTISYEASYLPFIFSSEAPGSSSEADTQKPKGRRVFNKNGVEEIAQEKEPEPTPVPTTVPEQKRLRVHPRPKTISGSAGLFGFPDQAPSKPKTAPSARQLIHDNTGVGEDLRPRPSKESTKPRPKPESTPLSTKAVFLKPAGVDDPHEMHATSADTDIIHGARNKKKSKRERLSPDQPDDENVKRKKKKKKVQKSAT